jgi:metal-responsive CopG/Arc/MetJ family transcriptional regulator
MKTIAVSIDERLLEGIDRIATRRSSSGGSGRRRRRPNRSQVIREAVREFLLRGEHRERESLEHRVLAAHRDRLSRQLEGLVGEQAAE